MDSKNASFDKIDKIILHDIGLTTRLHKLLIVPIGFPDYIVKISDAINVVGTEQLSYLLLSKVVTDKFKSIPKSVLNIDFFWKNSITYGLIAREMDSNKNNLETKKNLREGIII